MGTNTSDVNDTTNGIDLNDTTNGINLNDTTNGINLNDTTNAIDVNETTNAIDVNKESPVRDYTWLNHITTSKNLITRTQANAFLILAALLTAKTFSLKLIPFLMFSLGLKVAIYFLVT